MAHGVHSGDGSDQGGLSVGDVADCSDVDGGLSGDDFGGQGRQGFDVKSGQVLDCEMRLGE